MKFLIGRMGNILGKGENAGYQHFLLYQNVFKSLFPQGCLNHSHTTILDQTKLKAFAEDKLNVTKMIISVFDRLENIVGKGEIACTSNFSFSTMFSKGLFPRLVKRCHCVGLG